MSATPSPAEAALAPPVPAVAPGRGSRNDGRVGRAEGDPLLDALMRLAARHFGVAAACLLPGATVDGRERLGAGVDATLCEALQELKRINDRHSSEGSGAPLVVNDLGSDPAWQACLSRVSALPYRFVAAWPLTGPNGDALGSLCLLDPAPRELTAAQRASLDDFASMIAALTTPSDKTRETSQTETDLHAELASLRERERLLALAIAGSGTGIWDRNVVTGEIRYSKGWKAMLGYAEDEITSRIEDSYLRLHPEDLAYVQATMQAHFEGKTDQYEVEHRIRCKDGSYKWICSRGKVTARDADGRALRMVGTSTDVTSMREMAERLRESVNLITNLTNEVPGLVFQCRREPDGHTSFPYASAGIREIYELTPEQVASDAAGIDALIHPDDIDAWRASLAESAATLAPWHLEYRVRLPQQGLRWRQGDARPQRRDDGSTVWHGFITDVTERKRIEAELQEFATTDGLTRLANRRHFMSRLDAQLVLLRRTGSPQCALMMCDLDHFKSINDRFGHAVGDEALRHFADVLRNHLHGGDVAGRIGGEEFAILLSGADLDGACIVARRIQDCIAQAPLRAQEGAVALTVSIGVTPLRVDDASAEITLSRSDVALYRAKKGGRNRIECV
ncbi:diguanylate cyclase (GGDEF)-like protein/PAS domain S-box-containing protein [Paraburkholderia bannensis]|uniref:diguanylate cyclase n=1 Tax=Paraburkholderia bannensis TaxID=765414 RepID=A0A7W9WUN9_9BURK|nr:MULTISPECIES: diguanylate cyclase [Paraburkholderia]MBB3259841.1 diguanylate cyclase (GGDEF)-like protein/PAS domain S-box-containing protein [Paraburkholderia sp. WP4_3_2]MBB6104849.1 diguanylate cyclase (GGDEF)-like protein/PAS domain S-box-containing protein [Paraburkholderia bannensis]